MIVKKLKDSSRLISLVVFLIYLVFFLFNIFSLVNIPAIWPDEALHADLSMNILYQHRFGTDLLKGTLPGVENFGFGYPPLYFYTSAFWFKLIGFSIFKYRLLSFLLGVFFCILFYFVIFKLVSKTLTKDNFFGQFFTFFFLLLLVSDIAFIKAIHIARPEIEVLALGFLSLLFYLKSAEKKRQNFYLIMSGVTLGLAFLTHFLAVIFFFGLLMDMAISSPKEFYKKRESYLFIISFLIPVSFWLFSISSNIGYFLNDLTLRARYKISAPFWIWIVFSSSSLSTKLTYIIYFIVTWEILIYGYLSKNRRIFRALFLLLFSWVLTYIWQTEYSFIYVVVFVYLGLALLLGIVITDKSSVKRSKVLYLLACLIFFLNLYTDFNIFMNQYGGNYDYDLYTKGLLNLIPDNTSVYLSAAPDPYFGFKPERNNVLYEFPVLPTDKSNLINILDKSDYIIMNNSFERVVVGDVVNPYIKENSLYIEPVGSEGYQYQAWVIKLKTKNQRIH